MLYTLLHKSNWIGQFAPSTPNTKRTINVYKSKKTTYKTETIIIPAPIFDRMPLFLPNFVEKKIISEKQKRQYLAEEALLLGYGGISLINRITVSINTIRRRIAELQQGDIYECGTPERIEDGGRPKFTDTNTNVLEAIIPSR